MVAGARKHWSRVGVSEFVGSLLPAGLPCSSSAYLSTNAADLNLLLCIILSLQAIRSGDPAQIRQAQLLIAQRRAAAAAGERPMTGATPAGAPLFTPGGTAARALAGDTPYIPGLPPGVPARPGTGARPWTGGGGGGDAVPAVPVAPPVSLDAFLAAHTSEDNASFQEILESVNKRRRCVCLSWKHRRDAAAAGAATARAVPSCDAPLCWAAPVHLLLLPAHCCTGNQRRQAAEPSSPTGAALGILLAPPALACRANSAAPRRPAVRQRSALPCSALRCPAAAGSRWRRCWRRSPTPSS